MKMLHNLQKFDILQDCTPTLFLAGGTKGSIRKSTSACFFSAAYTISRYFWSSISSSYCKMLKLDFVFKVEIHIRNFLLEKSSPCKRSGSVLRTRPSCRGTRLSEALPERWDVWKMFLTLYFLNLKIFTPKSKKNLFESNIYFSSNNYAAYLWAINHCFQKIKATFQVYFKNWDLFSKLTQARWIGWWAWAARWKCARRSRCWMRRGSIASGRVFWNQEKWIFKFKLFFTLMSERLKFRSREAQNRQH